MMESLTLEIDEYNWTGDNAKSVVLKSFELDRTSGQTSVIRGRIQLLGGKPVG